MELFLAGYFTAKEMFNHVATLESTDETEVIVGCQTCEFLKIEYFKEPCRSCGVIGANFKPKQS